MPGEAPYDVLAAKGSTARCDLQGNNAGDGFVMARHLELRGYEARVWLWARPDEIARRRGREFQDPAEDRRAHHDL